MLKHRDPPAHGMSPAEAADAGIVDALFPRYAAASGADLVWLGPARLGALAGCLAAERLTA
jgi:hypothetical protein